MSVALSNIGTTGNFAPQIKRAVGRHPDGRTIVMVPDTNLATANGVDVTGVAKIRFYASDDSNRANYTLLFTYTPPVATSSATRRFVGSMVVGQEGDIFITFAGTDETLRMAFFNWNGTTYDAAVNQTVVAAGTAPVRYRALDIDVQWSGTASINPAIIAYESIVNANAGDGNSIFVYVRLNDGTTWIQAHQDASNGTPFPSVAPVNGGIKASSEDVAICWGGDGIVTNIGRLAAYWTRTRSASDVGDLVRELSFNVSTGTANSATVVGNWLVGLNQNTASGSRRGFLFRYSLTTGNPNWIFGTSVGISAPFFAAYKLHHNTFTGIITNKTIVIPSNAASTGFAMQPPVKLYSYVTANFADGAIEFVYSGAGVGKPYTARSVVLKWPAVENDTCEAIDAVARVKDGNFSLTSSPVLGVYGGSNTFPVGGLLEFTTAILYGEDAGNVSTTAGIYPRQMRADIEEVLSPPTIVSPVSTVVGVSRVTFQFSAKNVALYSDANGRVQFQVASDSVFTTALQTLIEDLPYASYSSSDNISSPTRFISVKLTQSQKLASGTWYVRARILDDLGGFTAWSSTATFSVLHAPIALPLIPAEGATTRFNSGDVPFTWSFSDTESGDTQSAYQLKILRTDTGVTVLDTGKVTSSVLSAVASLSPTLVDIPMSWSVSLWDSDNTQGAFSNPVNFRVSAPPVVVITAPVDAASLSTGLPTVTWTFAAGGTRTQKAFRVRITDTTANPSIIVGDSGWLYSTAGTYTFTSQILVLGKNYRVDVTVRDSTDQESTDTSVLNGNSSFETGVSGWTATNATFLSSTVRAHDGTKSALITPSAACTVTTITYAATAGHWYTASAYFYSPGGWNAVTISLDWRNNADASISVDTFSATLGAAAWTQYLKTAQAPVGTTGVRIKIDMTGAPTAANTVWVDEAAVYAKTINFTTSWVQPVLGACTVTTDRFKAQVHWTNAGVDVDFVAWRVYRRYNKFGSVEVDVNNTRGTWVLQYETVQVAAAYDYYDYTAPLNKSIDYVIVQVVERFGSVLESDITTFTTVTIAGNRYYFVPAVPLGTIASFEASNVTDDDFSLEVEQETLHVIGRGRQVQKGDTLGYDGQLTIKLRNPATARVDREYIQLLSSVDTGGVYVRSPFGDVLFANFGQVAFKRIAGMGLADLGDLTVPYLEIFEADKITRVV